MRAFRSPSPVSGLALVGAAFAGAAVIFGTAGGLVSFDFRPADPPQAQQRALVLPASRPAPAAPARVAAPALARPARPAPPPPSRAAAPVQSPPASAPPAVAPLPPTVVPAPGVARRQPQSQSPAPPLPPPVRAPQRSGALRPVGDLAGDTTTGLANVLRATTRALATGTEVIDPALATTLTEAGELLGSTVEGVGRALGGLLGSPPHVGPDAGGPTPP